MACRRGTATGCRCGRLWRSLALALPFTPLSYLAFATCHCLLNYWYTSGTFKLSPEIRRQQLEQHAPVHIHIAVLDNGPAGACFRKTLVAIESAGVSIIPTHGQR